MKNMQFPSPSHNVYGLQDGSTQVPDPKSGQFVSELPLQSQQITFDDGQRKKKKHKLTPQQSGILTREFEADRHPSMERRKYLAEFCHLPKKTIDVWFQNQRAKLKARTRQEEAKVQENFFLNPKLAIIAGSNFGDMNKEAATRMVSAPQEASASVQVSGGKILEGDDGLAAFPCKLLLIGEWKRYQATQDDISCYYSTRKAFIVYILRYREVEYGIKVPFSTIESIHVNMASSIELNPEKQKALKQSPSQESPLWLQLIIHLSVPPQFFATVNFQRQQCMDFTEGQQASRILIHSLYGEFQPTFRVIEDIKERSPELGSVIYYSKALLHSHAISTGTLGESAKQMSPIGQNKEATTSAPAPMMRETTAPAQPDVSFDGNHHLKSYPQNRGFASVAAQNQGYMPHEYAGAMPPNYNIARQQKQPSVGALQSFPPTSQENFAQMEVPLMGETPFLAAFVPPTGTEAEDMYDGFPTTTATAPNESTPQLPISQIPFSSDAHLLAVPEWNVEDLAAFRDTGNEQPVAYPSSFPANAPDGQEYTSYGLNHSSPADISMIPHQLDPAQFEGHPPNVSSHPAQAPSNYSFSTFGAHPSQRMNPATSLDSASTAFPNQQPSSEHLTYRNKQNPNPYFP
ncbi:homeobox transcription factor Phx1 [Schizosaccharomyces japonicus yFS275]|uniref:Homeobox transcription factor Phx1 n=1 Tax=Schizosaccharomyces japonicus (strain yFS275 / FY16936) TaxID=402676 RepID=B6K8C8_SCHJY|nr:homeobox transcription factor Phx1 [Schizosaccharomyces japonicus yFS275]EEB09782.2 homeobox transcription factor Phx1 [Schizosaccharomyces japonicus yFS275]